MYNVISKLESFKNNILERSRCTDFGLFWSVLN